jgi:hypothetical protein
MGGDVSAAADWIASSQGLLAMTEHVETPFHVVQAVRTNLSGPMFGGFQWARVVSPFRLIEADDAVLVRSVVCVQNL